MRTAFLRGRDHTTLGAIESVAEGPVGLALSVGGAPKIYRHSDPNEDAACCAAGEAGVLAAVADGHNGCEASQLAVGRLLARHAEAWTASDAGLDEANWPERALEALLDIHYAVGRGITESEHQHSRTTLALGLVRPAQRRLFHASLGDSHVFHVGSATAVELAVGRVACQARFFVGSASLTPAELRERATVGSASLEDSRALVLVTDGLSEVGLGVDDPGAAVARAAAAARGAPPGRRALETARALVREALASHRSHASGDNVAAAAVWVEN